MYYALTFLLILLSNNGQSSTVWISKSYNISDGAFLLIESYKDSLILNMYPAFYTTDYIPLSLLYNKLKITGNILNLHCSNTNSNWRTYHYWLHYRLIWKLLSNYNITKRNALWIFQYSRTSRS